MKELGIRIHGEEGRNVQGRTCHKEGEDGKSEESISITRSETWGICLRVP